MRRGLGATTAIIIAALIGAASASAGTTSALPTTTLSPAAGASHPASNYPVATDAEMLSFSLDLADGFTADYPVTVEIATAPTLGQDGTLADENQVGTFDLVRGDAAPQHYSGAIPTFAEWAAKPGKYYWVAHTFGVDLGDCSSGCTWVTPVRSFTLTAPKIVLDRSEAEEQAALALGQRYGKRFTQRAIDVRISCAQRLADAVRRCKASWQRRGVLYRARLDIVEKAGGNYAYRNAKLSQHAMHRRSGRASSLV